MKKIIAAILLAALTALSVSACSVPDNTPQESTENTSDTSQTEETSETDDTATSTTEEIPIVTPDMSEYGVVPADTKLNYEFTEEDEELHGILEELDNAWSVFISIINDPSGHTVSEGTITVNFTQVDEPYDMTYLPLSDELPFNDIDSMKAELRKCFTEDVARTFEHFMKLATGEVVSEADGVYTLDMVSYESLPVNDDGEVVYVYPLILEVNGKLYRKGDGYGAHLLGIDYSTTRVLSRTEDEIIFAFIIPYAYEEKIYTLQGRLRYEDGWKYDWDLYNNLEELGVLDFYEVWGDSYKDKVTVVGEHGRTADFDYSYALERIQAENVGDFLDDGYSHFKAMFQRAYTLAYILEGSPDWFRDTIGYRSSEDKPMIQVTDGHTGEYSKYYFSGISWDSFYEKMLEVFVKEVADELIFGNGLYYNYDGALWLKEASAGGDMSLVHAEYEMTNLDYLFIIDVTTYHVQIGEEPVFDPEKIDSYTTQGNRFGFILTDEGWRADMFSLR